MRQAWGVVFVLGLLLIGFPAIAHAQVASYVYNDSLGPGWVDAGVWNNMVVNYGVTNPVYSGTKAVSLFDTANNWPAWNLGYSAGFDTSPYLYLQFAAREDTANIPWQVIFLDANGGTIGSQSFTPPQNSWQLYTVNLSPIGAGYTKIYGIRFWHTTATVPDTMYVDAMGFGGAAPSPTPTPTPAPLTLSLSANASTVVNPFDRKMLGMAFVNWEFAYNRALPNSVPGLAQAMKAVNVSLIRYAGGLWANWVGWDRTVSKRDPYTTWTHNGNTYSFTYGTAEIDSLATLAQNIGSDVMVQVDVSQNDPSMWADMVKYTNIDHNYHFKYWEMGNELDGECSNGAADCISPAVYQQRVQVYSAAMKAIDPSIQIVGGVPSAAHDAFTSGNWSSPALSQYLTQAAPVSDALSWHWYQQCNNSSLTDMYTFSWPGVDLNLPNSAYSRSWSKTAPTNIQTQIISPGKPGQLQGVTELNYDACDFSSAPQNSNHANALWMADVLGRLAYNGLDFVTWYTGYGTPQQYAMVVKDPDVDQPTGVKLRPPYYTYFMYSHYFGDTLVQSNSADETKVSIWVAKDSTDPSKLALLITNLTPSTVTTPISLSGFTPTHGDVYQMTSTNPTDMTTASNTDNGWTTINGVRLDPMNVATSANSIVSMPLNVTTSNFSYVVSPYSLTAIVLHNSALTIKNDINGDGKIDSLDAAKIILDFGWTGSPGGDVADLNSDGKVDALDVKKLLAAW